MRYVVGFGELLALDPEASRSLAAAGAGRCVGAASASGSRWWGERASPVVSKPADQRAYSRICALSVRNVRRISPFAATRPESQRGRGSHLPNQL